MSKSCCGERSEIEVIARGVCIVGGKLLVCHTKGASNTYLPGGHVEFGEKAQKSLRREMKEEMGASFAVGQFLGAIEHSYRKKGRLQHEINLVFKMTCKTLKLSGALKSCEDYIEFLWLPLTGLPKSSLEPSSLGKLIPEWASEAGSVSGWSSTM